MKVTNVILIGILAVSTAHANVDEGGHAAALGQPGKTGELVWRFTKAGKFDFACLVPGHFEAGMQGKIAVRR